VNKLSKLSIGLGVVGCVLSMFGLGSYSGFSLGSAVCEVKYPLIGTLGWVSGLNPYMVAFDNQRLVCLFFITFMLGRCFTKQWVSHLLCTLSLLLLSIQFSQLFILKTRLWNDNDAYLRLAHELYLYDLIVLVTILVLLILEAVMIAVLIQTRETTAAVTN
jgi:hypothetical protein